MDQTLDDWDSTSDDPLLVAQEAVFATVWENADDEIYDQFDSSGSLEVGRPVE